MDSHSKADGNPAQTAGAPERDLTFLLPLIDKIRAVEIKFQGDVVPASSTATSAAVLGQGDVMSRLQALETEVAAIKAALQDTLGALSRDVSDAADAVAAAVVELRPQSWPRIVFAAVTTVILLLIAHWLVVFVYDLHTVVLRLISVVIPLPIALWLTLHYQINPRRQIAIAIVIGLIAVFGMSYVTSLHEHTSVMPQNFREWRETLEYVASIVFAYHTGVLISCAMQARSGARNRAGEATLRLARALASVTGKAVKTGTELKKQVDSIRGMINNLMPVASAIAAIIAGLKSVVN
jgi:ABC-type multidrug transport system fused ATPase/permease subunit